MTISDPFTPEFAHQFRVRYAEVDPQAVVFNSRYLEYADLVITEFWRTIGLHVADIPEGEKDRANDGAGSLEFHVVNAQVDYIKPIRLDEIIEGRAMTSRLGTSSLTTRIELWGTGDAADQRAAITLVNVHVDLASGKPLPIPDAARTALQSEPQS